MRILTSHTNGWQSKEVIMRKAQRSALISSTNKVPKCMRASMLACFMCMCR